MSSLKFVHEHDANNKDFICHICKEILIPKNTSQIIECSHIFCTECLQEISSSIYNKITCPLCNCHSKIDDIKNCNKFAYNTLSNIQIFCPNDGCDKILTLNDLDVHNSYCDFKMMDCSYCEKKNIKRKDLKNTFKRKYGRAFFKIS